MADIRKRGFHTVEAGMVEANVEEMEKKIRLHRKKIAVGIASAVVFVVLSVAAAGLYFAYKEYRRYEVISEIERNDSEATKYENFSGNILRYNNDGAFYADMSDNPIWNQAFEMQNPFADICGNYAAVADMQGNQIYIMHTSGVQGEIVTNKPITAVCMASQGTLAVLTQADGTSYIELFNKNGENLASGEIHVANSGYPLDIALSGDANKLALSILDISKGRTKTTIAFYNFGSAGQTEIDNMVGSYSYDDAIIPEISFVSNDRMIAFGDSQVIFFDGKQSPKQQNVLTFETEIRSIFFEADFFGLVYDKGDADGSHKMNVYDMDGNLKMEQKFTMDYQNIEFLASHEICVRNEYECEIYTMRGVHKFAYKFDDVLYRIFSGGSHNRYTFILNGVMERVKLK